MFPDLRPRGCPPWSTRNPRVSHHMVRPRQIGDPGRVDVEKEDHGGWLGRLVTQFVA
jgi:hypothetical protein